MMRWHRSGQSCIRPCMACPPGWRRSAAAFIDKVSGAVRRRNWPPTGDAGVSGESVEPEAGNVVRRRPGDGELGEDFADHAGEFEAMAGAGGGDQDLRRAGKTVDHEIAVRGQGIESGDGVAPRAV